MGDRCPRALGIGGAGRPGKNFWQGNIRAQNSKSDRSWHNTVPSASIYCLALLEHFLYRQYLDNNYGISKI